MFVGWRKCPKVKLKYIMRLRRLNMVWNGYA